MSVLMNAFPYAKTCFYMMSLNLIFARFTNHELRYSTCYSIKFQSSTCVINLKFHQHMALTHTHHLVHIRNKHCQLHFWPKSHLPLFHLFFTFFSISYDIDTIFSVLISATMIELLPGIPKKKAKEASTDYKAKQI